MVEPPEKSNSLKNEFYVIITQDGWTLSQISNLIRQVDEFSGTHTIQTDEKLVCITLLSWTDELGHVGTHETNRRYTRLQFIENALSLAGLYLTRRDFERSRLLCANSRISSEICLSSHPSLPIVVTNNLRSADSSLVEVFIQKIVM